TYGELDRLSDACASAFAALGIRRGDRVGLLLPNCPQFFIAEFGAWKLGAVVAPLNPIYTEHELEGPIRDHGIETVVTMTRFYQRIKNVQPRTGLKRVIATNIKEYFPPLLRVLFTLLREKRDGDRITLSPGDHDFEHLLATINRVKPTFFNGVPTLYIALLNHPDVQRGKVDFTSIRVCSCGASPLLADTKTRFEALTGARIIEGYSLTEAMMALCV